MTSPVAQITDHAARAVARLRGQFDKSPHIQALTEIIGDEIQLAENLLYALLIGRRVDTAIGDPLNQIGAVVGVARLGRTDTEYRRIIKVAILARRSDGGAEQIIDIASQLAGATVQYIQEGEARFRLSYVSDEALAGDYLDEALRLIGMAVSGGVAWSLTAGDTGTDAGARFDEARFDTGRFGAIVGSEGSDV